MRRSKSWIWIAVLACTLPTPAWGQGLDEVKARYTKYEFRIPMRDKVELFTAVYVPKDSTQPYPILLTRTPYAVRPYGVDQYKSDLGPNPLFGKEGYIFAYQDVRGRWNSGGTYVNVRPEGATDGIDESTDTYDTIDWLIKNVKGHNGKVGMYGISYPGFYTACGILSGHSALKAASPQAPVIDWFVGDDWHHNGAFMLTHCFNFMSNFGHPRPEPITKSTQFPFDHGTPDGYDFFLRMGPLYQADARFFKGDVAFWNELMAHPNYDDWWKARNLRPHLKKVTNTEVEVLTVGGWFDAENHFGALECYKALEASGAKEKNRLVMGPWFHGQWARDDGSSLGHVSFNSKTSQTYREQIELAFFNRVLKQKPSPHGELAEANVFETGTNVWRKFDAWPPRGSRTRSLYLSENGAIEDQAPTASEEVFDEYTSDPAHPVPYQGEISIGMAREYMVADQRFASRRPDVLTYSTPELKADLTIGGPIKVSLNLSTTGTDSDFVVKVIDVYPNETPDPEPNPTGVKMGGFQQLLRGDVMRGRFRESYSDPKPFKPGEVTKVEFTLHDVLHTFRPGHKLMVQVQSSWFPLIDRNPQSFVNIYEAKSDDFRKATQRLYRSQAHPSKIEVLVTP